MRVAPAINLADDERERLKSIARSRKQPLRLIQRVNIILLAERGLENWEIAERLQVSLPLVGGGASGTRPKDMQE
jgi:DNA-binding CsgD family transcriptional regulator